jgi:chemotaxis response regulator CheB
MISIQACERIVGHRGRAWPLARVQDPTQAAHPGMPHAAYVTGCVDFALPLEEIGPAITNLVMPGPESER